MEKIENVFKCLGNTVSKVGVAELLLATCIEVTTAVCCIFCISNFLAASCTTVLNLQDNCLWLYKVKIQIYKTKI
jgi:hypothetical protein